MRQFFETTYRPLRLVGTSPATTEQYLIAIGHWERFTGCLPISRADDISLARVMQGLLDSGDSPATANKVRRHLLAILRFAVHRGVLATMPEFPRVTERLRVPRAWLISEVSAILREAARTPGCICGIRASDWWRSLLLAIYDSGGRVGAVIGSRTDEFSASERTLRLAAERQKDRADQLIRLHESTVEAILATDPHRRDLLWPWPFGRGTLYKQFRRIVCRAGVESGRGTGSLFHRLRRTTASYLLAHGGDPTKQLGHSTPRVTLRYLDPRICGGLHAADLLPRPAC